MAQEVGLFCNNIVPHFNYRTTRTGSCVSGRILFFQINLVVYLHFISFQNYPASYNKSWFCSLYFVCYTYMSEVLRNAPTAPDFAYYYV